MALCPRGFLFRRDKDGNVLPLFFRVREEDIVWNKDTSGWSIRKFEDIGQVDLHKQIEVTELTVDSTVKAHVTIELPIFLKENSVIQVTKFSSDDIPSLEKSIVEANLTDFVITTLTSVSNTLTVYFFSSLGEFVQGLTPTGLKLNISIHGYL